MGNVKAYDGKKKKFDALEEQSKSGEKRERAGEADDSTPTRTSLLTVCFTLEIWLVRMSPIHNYERSTRVSEGNFANRRTKRQGGLDSCENGFGKRKEDDVGCQTSNRLMKSGRVERGCRGKRRWRGTR